MGVLFEELASEDSPLGVISLRRRREPALDVDVFEVKLGDEYLMSSLFTVAEVELANLGLAATDVAELDVVVGGLGLGYTAHAALQDDRVRSLVVIEALEEVIGWHERQLLPDTAGLGTDPRTRFVAADFFSLAAGDDGFDPTEPGRAVHAILLDIDHSPRNVLHPANAALYTADGLRALARHLLPGGVFALWSDDPPDEPFERDLRAVFHRVDTHVVSFRNHYLDGESSNTVYVAS